MNEKLTEQYWRTDFEASKALKEANFYKKCGAFYKLDDGEYIDKFVDNHNKLDNTYCASAPLISVAKEWLNEKGYAQQSRLSEFSVGWGNIHYALFPNDKEMRLNNKDEKPTQRELDLAFIQTCCKHIIENK